MAIHTAPVDNASSWSSGSGSDEDSLQHGSEQKVVLLTGGAGFIGSHTGISLLSRGDKVVVIDEMNDYYDVRIKRSNISLLEEKAAAVEDAEFVFCEGNICDRDLLEKIFTEHSPTHVCHLAARAGVRPSIDDPQVYVQTNVMGTVLLLEFAAKFDVENFVYASSSSVYGGSMKERFSELDSVDEPVSQYAATKKATELFAATYNSLYGLNCTGLRFFTVYGERGRPDMAPFKFVNYVQNGITINQYGDGTSERDYTYIEDIVTGVVLALDKPLGNTVINLGRGTPVSLTKFIRTVEDMCGRKANINVIGMQPGDVMRTSCDTTRAKELLGYEAKVSLEEGLRKTVDWYCEWEAKNGGF